MFKISQKNLERLHVFTKDFDYVFLRDFINFF